MTSDKDFLGEFEHLFKWSTKNLVSVLSELEADITSQTRRGADGGLHA
jgi:hypothetical protein